MRGSFLGIVYFKTQSEVGFYSGDMHQTYNWDLSLEKRLFSKKYSLFTFEREQMASVCDNKTAC